jgi:adenylylsulfate kinase
MLWAPPRSLSTAFLRVMAARGDLEVLHEPMCDLAAGERHELPTGDFLDSVAQLCAHIDARRAARPVFVKETCEYDYRPSLMGTQLAHEATHVFMLREPAKVINSHYSVNPQLRSDDVGFRHLASLLDFVKTHGGRVPVFVDAERLQAAPECEVAAFCARVGLAHIPGCLTWQPGHLDLWRRTQRWHEDAAASSGIEFREREYTTRVDNEPRLRRMYEENLPFYRYLKQACETQPQPKTLQAVP